MLKEKRPTKLPPQEPMHARLRIVSARVLGGDDGSSEIDGVRDWGVRIPRKTRPRQVWRPQKEHTKVMCTNMKPAAQQSEWLALPKPLIARLWLVFTWHTVRDNPQQPTLLADSATIVLLAGCGVVQRAGAGTDPAPSTTSDARLLLPRLRAHLHLNPHSPRIDFGTFLALLSCLAQPCNYRHPRAPKSALSLPGQSGCCRCALNLLAHCHSRKGNIPGERLAATRRRTTERFIQLVIIPRAQARQPIRPEAMPRRSMWRGGIRGEWARAVGKKTLSSLSGLFGAFKNDTGGDATNQTLLTWSQFHALCRFIGLKPLRGTVCSRDLAEAFLCAAKRRNGRGHACASDREDKKDMRDLRFGSDPASLSLGTDATSPHASIQFGRVLPFDAYLEALWCISLLIATRRSHRGRALGGAHSLCKALDGTEWNVLTDPNRAQQLVANVQQQPLAAQLVPLMSLLTQLVPRTCAALQREEVFLARAHGDRLTQSAGIYLRRLAAALTATQ